MSTTRRTPTPAEASRLALAAARDTLGTRQTEHDTAAALVEELTDRLHSGDATVTTADLTNAEAGVRRAAILLSAAESAVQVAETMLINDDFALAETIADVVRDDWRGLVPVKVTAVADEAVPDPTGPVIYVVQSMAAVNEGGDLSGDLDIVFYRDRRFAPLDGEELTASCLAKDHRVAVTDRSDEVVARDRTEDRLRVRVNAAFPTVPTLPGAPDEHAVRYFAQGVNGRLLAAVQAWNEPTNHNLTPDTATYGRAHTKLVGFTQGRTMTDKDGVTRTSVTVKVSATESVNYDGEPAAAIRNILGRYEGEAQRSVGRVESVTVDDIVMPEFRTVGKLPWVITATFVLAYRVS